MTWLSRQNRNFPQGSPCKQRDNDLVNIEGEGMISRKELQEKGVEAFPSHPKNKLRKTKPGDWERRAIYDELDWKYDDTVPKSFKEKVGDWWDENKDEVKEVGKKVLTAIAVPTAAGPIQNLWNKKKNNE